MRSLFDTMHRIKCFLSKFDMHLRITKIVSSILREKSFVSRQNKVSGNIVHIKQNFFDAILYLICYRKKRKKEKLDNEESMLNRM